MQHVTVRITKDAQVKIFESGRSVVNFSVVENRYYKNQEGQRVEKPTFYQCSFWRTEKIAPYLTKGQIVELYGDPIADCYLGTDGKPVAVLRLNVNEIIFHSAQKKEEGTTQGKAKGKAKKQTDEVPF